MKDLPDLTRTSEALAAFDAVMEPYDSGYGTDLAKAVGVAFGLDTADRNNQDDCAALIRPGPREPQGGEADLSFVRRMVRQWKVQ